MTILQSLHFAGQLSKGQRTRRLILNGAIDVLAKHGMKGTTHRAIAQQAKLQLSLTTYYFKDIRHLIHEAFLLSSTRTIASAHNGWQQVFILFDQLGKTRLRKLSIRRDLARNITRMKTSYLINRVTEHANDVAVEKMLYTEMQCTEALRSLAENHRQLLSQPFSRFCHYFAEETAEIDAEILMTMFSQLEYRNIAKPVDQIDEAHIYQTIYRLIQWVLKVKKSQSNRVDALPPSIESSSALM